MFNIYFCLRSTGRKLIVENILAISNGFGTVLSFTVKIFRTSDGLGLTLNIDFIPSQVF